MGNRTLDVVDDEPGGQRRPVIYAERTAADKLFEPFPARIPVVVRGYVEAEPRAVVFHVSLESLLLRPGRTAIEPDDELVLL